MSTVSEIADRATAGAGGCDRVFNVVFGTALASNLTSALTATGIPVKADPHPVHTKLVAGSPRAEWLSPASKRVVRVTVSYAEADKTDPVEKFPWQKPGIVSGRYQRYSVVATYARRCPSGGSFGSSAVPIVNINGEPYDPPLMRDYQNFIVQIRKSLYSWDHASWWAAVGTVNQNAFTVRGVSAPAKSAILLAAEASEAWYGIYKYYEAYFEVEITKQTDLWAQTVLECGFRIMKTGVTGLVGATIKINGDDVPVASPVLIAADGKETTSPIYTRWDTTTVAAWPAIPELDPT